MALLQLRYFRQGNRTRQVSPIGRAHTSVSDISKYDSRWIPGGDFGGPPADAANAASRPISQLHKMRRYVLLFSLDRRIFVPFSRCWRWQYRWIYRLRDRDRWKNATLAGSSIFIFWQLWSQPARRSIRRTETSHGWLLARRDRLMIRALAHEMTIASMIYFAWFASS